MQQQSVISQFIVDEFIQDIREDQLEPDFDLIVNGVIDSLGLLKVIAWIEERFQLSIEVTEMTPENFASVNAICAFIDRAQQPQSA